MVQIIVDRLYSGQREDLQVKHFQLLQCFSSVYSSARDIYFFFRHQMMVQVCLSNKILANLNLTLTCKTIQRLLNGKNDRSTDSNEELDCIYELVWSFNLKTPDRQEKWT